MMEQFARGTKFDILTIIVKQGSETNLRFWNRSLACAHVDGEEYIKLYECGKDQKHGVHGKAGAPHRRIQLKLVKPKRQVQH